MPSRRKLLLRLQLWVRRNAFPCYVLGGLIFILSQTIYYVEQASSKALGPIFHFVDTSFVDIARAPQSSTNLTTYIKLRSEARKGFHLDDSLLDGLQHPRRVIQTSSRDPGQSPLTIAQFSHVYGPSSLWADESGGWTSCPHPCQAVGDYGDTLAAASADVVIFSLPDFRAGAPWKRPPGQLWVGTYFESPDHYPSSKDKRVLGQFNLTMGFSPRDDLPVFNMIFDTFKDFALVRNYALPSWETKCAKDTPMMSAWISNCGLETNHRLAILEELASHGVTYASYGRCKMTNDAKTAVSTLESEDWRRYGAKGSGREKVAASTNHLFFYAAENSKYPYYITEKVFHGLLAGSVPVYVGDASHLKMIAPPNSIIYAEDYGSTRELADHLLAVANDQSFYESYLAWRSDPEALRQLDQIMALPQWAMEHPDRYACAVCEMLHSSLQRSFD